MPTLEQLGYGSNDSSHTGWSQNITGSIGAAKKRKELLLEELERTATPGRFEGEKAKARGELAGQIGAQQQAQAMDVAQQTIAGGPLAAVSGRGAKLQQELAGQYGEGLAKGGAAIEDVYERKGEAERQAALAALERQQDRARQNAQYWGGLLFGSAVKLGAGAAGGGG